jgi:uncharacterized membrane protein
MLSRTGKPSITQTRSPGLYCRNATARGFLWRHGKFIDLGIPAGFSDDTTTLVTPSGINDRGDIAGTVQKGATLNAFLWQDRKMTVVVNGVIATGINNAGEITSFIFKSGGYHTFLYSHGGVRDLGTLPGATGMRAFAINNRGHIAGEADFPPPPSINSPLALWTGASWRNLGSVPGDLVETFPFSINAFDEIVGFSSYPGGFRAFLWNGGFTVLPCTPAGALCEATGINDGGTIVGSSTLLVDAGTSIVTPLIWFKGSAFDLASLIDPRDPLRGQVSLQAYRINNSGGIVADGEYQGGPKTGQLDVFLVTPVEEVATRP